MKIVFEMNDDTFKDIDCLILSQDSTKAYYFDEIVENCVPLSEVLDKIRSEIDSHCSDNRDRNDGLYIAMRIIDKYKAEGSDKE